MEKEVHKSNQKMHLEKKQIYVLAFWTPTWFSLGAVCNLWKQYHQNGTGLKGNSNINVTYTMHRMQLLKTVQSEHSTSR